VLAVADQSPAARKRVLKAYPGIKVTPDASEVISSAEIDAIAVVTPVWTHYELAKAALEHLSTSSLRSHSPAMLRQRMN
jgi:predicted dehydrogenase